MSEILFSKKMVENISFVKMALKNQFLKKRCFFSKFYF